MSTYSSLREKYNNFSVPSYGISADGAELSGMALSEIYVDLSVGTVCGACRFTLEDIYERGSRAVSGQALSKLKPGTAISVSLGYMSECSQVFSGYINELKLRFNEDEISLGVCCLDARGMMRLGRRRAVHQDKTMEDVISGMLDGYAPLIASKDITLAALEKDVSIVQDTDDLSFVAKAAQVRGLYFFMENDKAVIAKASSEVCVEFDWEQTAMDFSIKYLDAKIEGTGYDAEKMERFSVETEAKQKAQQAELLTVSQEMALGAYLAGDSAEAAVTAAADIAVRTSLSGEITCHGIPEVKLGQKIKVNKFPFSASGTGDTFTVISVSHRIDEDGFFTIIGIEG